MFDNNADIEQEHIDSLIVNLALGRSYNDHWGTCHAITLTLTRTLTVTLAVIITPT